MPTYTFYDKKTGKEWDDMMSNSEREEYLKDNPNISAKSPAGLPLLAIILWVLVLNRTVV